MEFQICDDCNLMMCGFCTAADCECDQLSHTIAPTVLIRDALEHFVNLEADADVQTSVVNRAGGIDLEVTMDHRRYRVTVEPA